MRSKLITIKFSRQLLKAVDEAARKNRNTRSGFIRETLVMRLNEQHMAPNPRAEDILQLLKNTK